jgi:two-component system phosphate regulon response regulator PhoB
MKPMPDVLIVDDNADIRRLLTACLQKEFDVLEAPDGRTALQMIRQFRPKIVMLDVMMPGELNGLQVLSEIREDTDICDTTVVMVTALCQENQVANAKRHGADGYLVKPFSTLEVQDWVRSQLTPS